MFGYSWGNFVPGTVLHFKALGDEVLFVAGMWPKSDTNLVAAPQLPAGDFIVALGFMLGK